jgi:predicted RNase H-like HicB family nuclease
MVYTHRVDLETDAQTGQVCVTLPALNDLSDFGETVEEALKNLKHLAEFALRYRHDDGEPIPPSDPFFPGVTYLSLEVPAPVPTGSAP